MANGQIAKGKLARSEATQLLHSWLADGEWHDYGELTQRLLDSSVPLPFRKNHTDTERARLVIKEVGARNSFEVKRKIVGRRTYIVAIRKSPRIKFQGTLRSCSRCGKPDLATGDRVRRSIEYRIPARRGRSSSDKGEGDVIAARMKTTYLCTSCGQEELDSTGTPWRYHPPFYNEGGELIEKKYKKKSGPDQQE